MGILKQINTTVKSYLGQALYNYVGNGWFRVHESGGDQDKMTTTGMYEVEPYIYGCTTIISQAIASLPLRLYRYKKDGSKEMVDNHQFQKVIDKPNFLNSGADLKEWLAANYCITGVMYLYAPDKETVFVLNSRCVSPKLKDDIKNPQGILDIVSKYEYKSGGATPVEYPAEDVVFESNHSLSRTLFGHVPLTAVTDSALSNVYARRANLKIFENDMRPSAVMQSEDKCPPEDEKERLYKDWDSRLGANNHHKTLFLWNKLKYSPLSMTPKDLDYINGLKLNRSEICGCVFQVPEILLGAFENSSFNNLSEAQKMLYIQAVKPRATRIAELYQKVFEKWYGDSTGLWVEFDYSGVEALQEDRSKKIADLTALIAAGITRNEAIRYLELPFDTKDKTGDIRYLPFSLAPIRTGSEPVTIVDDDTDESKRVRIIDPELAKKAAVAKAEAAVRAINWTPETKRAKWDAFKGLTDRIDLAYRKDLAVFFASQRDAAIKRLRLQKGLELSEVADGVAQVVDSVTKKPVDIDGILFRDGTEIDRLRGTSAKYHREALIKQGQAEYQLLGLEASFQVTNPRIEEFLAQYGLEKATTVLESAKDGLRDALIEGVNAGEGIDKLVARMSEYYADYTDIEKYKLVRIAQTEVVGAANQGSLESYEQIGSGRIRKGWLPAYNNTRDSHIKAGDDYGEGNEIPLDELFTVGSAVCLTPGQTGVAEEDISCHCVIFPQLKE
jgi:HK97 family phage portal protein